MRLKKKTETLKTEKMFKIVTRVIVREDEEEEEYQVMILR